DAQPPPVLDFNLEEPARVCFADLDRVGSNLGCAELRAQAFTLWLRSARFDRRCQDAAALIRRVLTENPFTTLQVVLEPVATDDAGKISCTLGARELEVLWAACQENPTYLDRYYALQ